MTGSAKRPIRGLGMTEGQSFLIGNAVRSKVMFAQLANTLLHGVRIFDEAAKNTTPAEMNRPDDCDEARSGHHRGENSRKKGNDNDVR